MGRFRGHVERRLFNAVLLVLGACDHSLDAQAPTKPPPAPGPDAGVAVTPVVPPDAGAAVVVATTPGSPAAAKKLCDTYRKTRPAIDKKQAKQGPLQHSRFGGKVGVVAQEQGFSWDQANGVAHCTIVHERKAGTVTVLHEYHWCPQGGGDRPGPVPVEVQGERLLLERTVLRPDGTVVKTGLEWVGVGGVEEERHNCGRRFEGLELDPRASDDPGAQLAAMAELEAASVPAFERLARELATWGAPDELVRRARQAMGDEIRHARVMAALARARGHEPRPIEVPPLPVRSLEAIALENALEGCVREAYGALIATYQAERATPELRAAFRSIAADERAHAELAEEVHAWVCSRLDAAAGEVLECARDRAVVRLRHRLRGSRECRELGLPSAPVAVALFDAYFA